MLLLEDKLTKAYEAIRKSDINFNEFGISGDDECDNYYIEDAIQTALDCAGVDAYVATGASKLAIIINGCSKVIKIPFNGCWECVWEDDEIVDEYFESFSYANDLKLEEASCWDYCANELNKYEIAEEAGYAPLFAKIERFGMIKDHPVYIQERVCEYSGFDSRKFRKDYTNGERQDYSEYRKSLIFSDKNISVNFGLNFGILLFQTYGSEMFENICKFLHENEMNHDLHSGNVGFTMDGRPIILDFAGWRK